MKLLFVLMILATSVTVNPVYAGQNEYDDCLLTYLKNAKVDSTTQIIIGACRENYKEFTILPEKRKRYNECLLENIPGIESGDAIVEIKNVCTRRYL